MKSEIFRNYDIRGIYGKDLDENIAYQIGYYFGQKSKGEVIIGYDGRHSAPAIFKALAQGILDAESVPVSIGLVPTPLLYYANTILKPGVAIMITASHNSKEYIGFKMLLAGEPFCGDRIAHLKDYVANSEIEYKERELPAIDCYDLSDQYLDRIFEDMAIDPNLKIAWDIGNGAAGSIIENLIDKMPNENIIYNKEVDGNFPSRSPDPTDHNNLSDLVENIMMDDFDLGIAFDGDGDRVVFVTSAGDILEGDQALLIFAQDVLKANPSATIISEVKASRILFDEVEKLGGKAIMTQTGHSNIKRAIKKEKAELAGELSCHFFFPDKYFGFDDAIYGSLRMIDLITRSKKSLADLYDDLPKLNSSPEIKIEVAEERKFEIVELIKEKLVSENREFIDIDGIRLESAKGWWLIRASNTSPSICVRMEGVSEDALQEIEKEVKGLLEEIGVILSLSLQRGL